MLLRGHRRGRWRVRRGGGNWRRSFGIGCVGLRRIGSDRFGLCGFAGEASAFVVGVFRINLRGIRLYRFRRIRFDLYCGQDPLQAGEDFVAIDMLHGAVGGLAVGGQI